MPLPNCLVIGAMRSGTSTLYQLLAQHPDVFMSTPKEPNYFAFADMPDIPVEASDSVTNLADYERLFQDSAEASVRGEASHNYLYYSDRAAPLIRRTLPDVRLVAILRNPVDRAFSHYMLHVRNEKEHAATFREALDLESVRIERGDQFGHYVARGFYAQQLGPFLQQFPSDALRIFLYEDLAGDAVGLAQDVYGYLGIDASFAPDTAVRSNPSGVPRNRAVHGLLVKDNAVKRALQPLLPRSAYRLAVRIRDRNLNQESMDPEIRSELAAVFRPEIEALQEVVDRDLSAWLL
ncbi:MAG TPA: sulfotransferase [Acidimicrobiia bacterium]|jgi:hypothetical protein|nr:sulfotransferase [Acidimicrobiia bacterium]